MNTIMTRGKEKRIPHEKYRRHFAWLLQLFFALFCDCCQVGIVPFIDMVHQTFGMVGLSSTT